MRGKSTREGSFRKRLILLFVTLFHLGALLFVFSINDWFLEEGPVKPDEVVVNNEEELNKEVEKNKDESPQVEEQAENESDKVSALTDVHIPIQYPFSKEVSEKYSFIGEDTMRTERNNVVHAVSKIFLKNEEEEVENLSRKERMDKIKEVSDQVFSEVKNVLTSNERKGEGLEKGEEFSDEQLENVVQEELNELGQDGGVASAEKKEEVDVVDEVGKIDFTEYEADLMKNYGVKEGEKIPLLSLEDYGDEDTYKKGLRFYGYQRLVARPKQFFVEGKPFYFVFKGAKIEMINKEYPYHGVFPAALQKDCDLFYKLVEDSQYVDLLSVEYQIFYAPDEKSDMVRPMLLVNEQKRIMSNLPYSVTEVESMIGSFKKVKNSYRFIIEFLLMNGGKIIPVVGPERSAREGV